MLIQPERTSNCGPFTQPFWPNGLLNQDGEAPFRGLGDRWWIGNQKKGNTRVLPLLMQR